MASHEVEGVVAVTTSPADEPGDETLAAFLQSVELAAVGVYSAASRLLGSPAAVQAAAAFSAHHVTHAHLLGQLAGARAVRGANPGLAATEAVARRDLRTETDQLGFLYFLEGQLAATYQYALARFTGVEALQRAAEIGPVEGQHAVLLGTLLGKSVEDLVPVFQADSGFFDPGKFPAG